MMAFLGFNTAIAQVGIGTENPEADLHIKSNTQSYTPPTQAYPADVTTRVEGNLVVDKVGEADTESVPLSWNPKTHEISRAVEENKKLFNVATYEVDTESTDEYISNLNTLIPADKYTMIINSARLTGYDQNGNEQEAFVPKPNSDSTTRSGSSIKVVQAYVYGGTWRITADYPETVPHLVNTDYHDTNFVSTFDVMIINNTLIEFLGTRNIQMGGSYTGSDSSPIID